MSLGPTLLSNWNSVVINCICTCTCYMMYSSICIFSWAKNVYVDSHSTLYYSLLNKLNQLGHMQFLDTLWERIWDTSRSIFCAFLTQRVILIERWLGGKLQQSIQDLCVHPLLFLQISEAFPLNQPLIKVIFLYFSLYMCIDTRYKDRS